MRLHVLIIMAILGGSMATAAAPIAPEVAMNRQWAERAFAVGGPAGHLPFSFVYGGRSSRDFLGTWTGTVSEAAVNATTRRRTLTFTDSQTGLEVKAVCTIYTDTPGVDWTLSFTNTGIVDTPILEQVLAVDAAVPVPGDRAVAVHRLHGSPCAVDDWMPFDQPLPAGERLDFATNNGRSANVSPFFNVSRGDGGVITAIGWSGQWAASVAHTAGAVRTQAGMQTLHTTLRPGESIRSPRILQVQWSGNDPNRGYNLFRRTMMAHILPRRQGALILPPIVHLSTSFYEMNATNEANVLAHLQACKGLGFEMFWLDAYWTGPDGFPHSMGNYGFPLERVVPKDRFPHGLEAIGAAVKQSGMGFVLWFEPERVVADTLLAKEHPEWVLTHAGADRSQFGLFDLGNPAARAYMTEYLQAAITKYQVDCLRIDYNIDPLAYWQAHDTDPSRVGMTELRYVEGLYRMWDDLLRANPSLFIDNCASGGRRIDLETCARALALWRSDNTCDMVGDDPEVILMAAVKNQVMSGGLNRYLPWGTNGQMGADPYRFRSGFNAGIAFCEDIRPREYPRDELAKGIAEGKRLRPYWFGDYYPLTAVTADPADWLALQYHRPEQQDGIVLAFRRHRAPAQSITCRLNAVDSTARYQVTFAHSYEPERTVTMTGAELQGLTLDIPACPGSLLIEYRKLRK